MAQTTIPLDKNYPFIITLVFEAFFTIPLLLGIFGVRGLNLFEQPYWWAITIGKILLGCLVYTLVFSRKKYTTRLGALIFVTYWVVSVIFYNISRDSVYPWISGTGIILITANSRLLIWTIRNPREKNELDKKYAKHQIFGYLIMAIITVTGYGLGYFLFTLNWFILSQIILERIPVFGLTQKQKDLQDFYDGKD